MSDYLPPGNPNAAPADYRRLVERVPDFITSSWDWQWRCTWRPELMKRRLPEGMTFTKAIRQRLEATDQTVPLDISFFDMGAARRPCEVAYTEKLQCFTNELFRECGFVDGRLLAFNQGFFRKTGVPGPFHEGDEMYTLPKEKKWERYMRHRTKRFIAHHQREAFVFSDNGLQQVCVWVPRWFEGYEVHYGLHVETPLILLYKGSALLNSERSGWWQVFLTEWAALTAYELIYEARKGKLLYIPPKLREAIREIGFLRIMDEDEELADQLRSLIREIDLIRWSNVSPRNRALPEYAQNLAVTISGNWVAFDTEAWESQMEDCMYLEEGEDGRALYGPELPIGRLTGYIDRAAEEHRATRPSRDSTALQVPVSTAGESAEQMGQLAAGAPTAGASNAGPSNADPARGVPNQRKHRRAAQTLNQVLRLAGVDRLLSDQGYPNGISLDEVADVLRLHLVECRRSRVKREDGGAPANAGDPAGSGTIRTIGEELDAQNNPDGSNAAKPEATEVKAEPAEAATAAEEEPPAKRVRVSEGAEGSTAELAAATERLEAAYAATAGQSSDQTLLSALVTAPRPPNRASGNRRLDVPSDAPRGYRRLDIEVVNLISDDEADETAGDGN